MGRSKRRKPTLAERADRYALYQESVQAVDVQVDFFHRVYEAEFGRRPRRLREDFCGTHLMCCEWVGRGDDYVAEGVDIDPEPLTWGRSHNQSMLTRAARKRLTIREADVRDPAGQPCDVLSAENFSYWVFRTRAELAGYFRAARDHIAERGLMVVDAFGGPTSISEDVKDVRKLDGFRYVWDQARVDPISHAATFHIHFVFPDRSKLKKAFTYRWRFWTIPELRELLLLAGFQRVDVYWEGTDPDTGQGNGEYERVDEAPQDPAWVAYLVGVK